jgi:co-chaperonin GroES (HSP10)
MIQPLDGRLLVEVQGEPEKVGSLFVPPHEHELRTAHALQGVVLALADDCQKTHIKVGDRVAWSPLAGTPYKPDPFCETKFLLVHEDRILCIINPKETT